MTFFSPHIEFNHSLLINNDWIWLRTNSPLGQHINCGQTDDFYSNIKRKLICRRVVIVIPAARCCFSVGVQPSGGEMDRRGEQKGASAADARCHPCDFEMGLPSTGCDGG